MLKEFDADPAAAEALLALPRLYGGREILDEAARLPFPPASRAALTNLADVVTVLENYGLADRVILDLAEAHAFEYCTGVVFGAFARGLGYQLSNGGRYDHLIGQFGYPCPATGFSFDLERVMAALEAARALPEVAGPDVLLIDFSPDKRAAHRLARLLRERGVVRRPGHHQARTGRLSGLRQSGGHPARRHPGPGGPAGRDGPRPRTCGPRPSAHFPWRRSNGPSQRATPRGPSDFVGRPAPHHPRGAMANIIVVGAQWGDEGKGKVVDFLSERFDVVARYQGGNNAGHTVVVGDDKIVLHLIPSGVLRKGKTCVLGNGVVIDLGELIQEMDQLERLHVKFEDHFFISRRAHLVLPYHKLLDVAHEQRAAKKIGTTGRGIGPAYVDKMARVGIRVGDLHQPALFKERLSQNLAEKRAQFPESRALAALEPDRMFHDHLKHYERIQNHLADASLVLDRLMREGKQVLFEGAQGTLLDVDLGTYPYVTSSSATAGGACTGTGVSPKRIDGILGICKAYTTRVGEGPFPTELADEIGDQIRERGAEFGATTGRPRRTGWFDAVGVRYAVRVNGLDALALMKLDVLDGLETLQVCTAYRYRGELLTEFPNETDILAECEPVYETLPGWTENTVGIVDEAKLPANCQAYLRRLEAVAGVPLALISTGPRRDQTIMRSDTLWKSWGLA